MARKAGSTISQEQFPLQSDELARPELDDARLLDLEVEEESPFLRAQKRVSVRRGSLPKKTATRLTSAAVGLGIVALCGVAVTALYQYGEHSWRFRIESSDQIEIVGQNNVTRTQVMEVMGEDIGRNIFFVPLAQRQKQLEQIPWVESASVMRFAPNRLRIEIHERTPVAFARVGSRIQLVDAEGSLLDLPNLRRKKFSFPVILGMNPGEPPVTRAERMQLYNQLITDLDSTGAHYSQGLSEVDLTTPDDVKVLASDPGGEVLVHLGSSGFLERFKIYLAHVQEWRTQFARLDSVDLRYDHQIVVNPDLQGTAKEPALPMSVAHAALAAGVKPAALVNHDLLPNGQAGTATAPPAKSAVKAVSARRRSLRVRRKRSVLQKTNSSSATQTVKAGNQPNPGIPKGQEQ